MSNIGTKFNLANRFIFDPNTNSLVDSINTNEVVRMGSNESRILLFLSENPNQVVSRNQLYDFVWREQGFEVDDSSLTQAISTLRKLLNDSTKSPEFIKTVPKRGYQLICHVERTKPLYGGDHAPSFAPSAPSDALPLSPELETSLVEEESREIEANDATSAEQPPQPPAKSLSKLTKATLVIAILLPILTFLFSEPSTSEFRVLATYSGVYVKTPLSHPNLSKWLPAIKQCVARYKNSHAGESAPIEVIATGGQNNQLVLNYIHQLNHSGENITVTIFSDQSKIEQICQ